jgi:hypothetical protein
VLLRSKDTRFVGKGRTKQRGLYAVEFKTDLTDNPTRQNSEYITRIDGTSTDIGTKSRLGHLGVLMIQNHGPEEFERKTFRNETQCLLADTNVDSDTTEYLVINSFLELKIL